MFFSVAVDFKITSLLTRTTRSGKARTRWLLLGLVMLLPQQHALADLMLHPTRIVIEKNQRAAQLELINNGLEAATYRISLVNRRMSETGEFTAIDSAAPGEHFADALLRYSPRQITLEPGVGQVVRIMLRKPADLAAGEYRSHLQFDKQPEPKGATSIETQGPVDKEVGVVLTALVGASIPVIVRHGETAATVSLSHLEMQISPANQKPLLSLRMNRSGNRSVYGDLSVTFTPQGGSEQLIGRAGGLAVYSPNPLRRAKLALQPPAGMAMARGTLRATYRERPEAGGKVLAESEIVLP
ncbi:molecular chaperone [Lacisediminimonas sp.]|uniref:molecular chaperone n=1 Tax=Lacisediminimonas sp. TaxID=3060582 RepID=UPI0027170775|nr:molecular chaperone [Lacisediminimonas sp.]MDO8301291.1 molecular chaperone [Lacisediminimonas sp.]